MWSFIAIKEYPTQLLEFFILKTLKQLMKGGNISTALYKKLKIYTKRLIIQFLKYNEYLILFSEILDVLISITSYSLSLFLKTIENIKQDI